MLGSDRSRGYCLEMICADFLARANLENGDPELLLFSMLRFFRFLSVEQQHRFLQEVVADGTTSTQASSPAAAARDCLQEAG